MIFHGFDRRTFIKQLTAVVFRKEISGKIVDHFRIHGVVAGEFESFLIVIGQVEKDIRVGTMDMTMGPGTENLLQFFERMALEIQRDPFGNAEDVSAVDVFRLAGEGLDQNDAAAEMIQPFQTGQFDGDGMKSGQVAAAVFAVSEVAGMDIQAGECFGNIPPTTS